MSLPRKQNLGRWLLGVLLLAAVAVAFPVLKREMLLRKARLVLADLEILDSCHDQWFMEHGEANEYLPLWANIEVYLRTNSRLRRDRGRDVFGNPFIIGTGYEGIAIHPDTRARFAAKLNTAEFFGNHDGRLLPPAIILAARAGDAARVRALVESGVNINEPDHYGRTPLFWAAQIGHAEVARTICSMHPSPIAAINANRPGNPSPLLEATSGGHVSVLQVFFDFGIRIDDPNLIGTMSDWIYHPNVVKLLLSKGMSPNAVDGNRGEPLIVSAGIFGNAESIRLLLEAGADVSARDRDGTTALLGLFHIAHAPAESIRLLLDAGADVNARDRDGKTALQEAIRLGNHEAEKLLREAVEKARKP